MQCIFTNAPRDFMVDTVEPHMAREVSSAAGLNVVLTKNSEMYFILYSFWYFYALWDG